MLIEIQITTLKGWQIATGRGATGAWVSWAKMGAISGTDPINEPGEHVWFEFGRTREQAFQNLADELGLRNDPERG